MFKRSLETIVATWLAGLVVFLPLALTFAVLGWLIGLLNQYAGPGSELGYLFQALGYSVAGNSPMPYLLGTLVLVVAIYLLGLAPSHDPVEIEGRQYFAVLVPTAPVPIGGGLLYVPVEWVKPANMGIDKLTEIYVSMGLTPPSGPDVPALKTDHKSKA